MLDSETNVCFKAKFDNFNDKNDIILYRYVVACKDSFFQSAQQRTRISELVQLTNLSTMYECFHR